MSRWRWSRGWIAAVGALALVAVVGPATPVAAWPSLTPTRWELKTGYGYQYKNPETRPNNYQVHYLLPSLVVPLTDPIGPAWARGRFTWNPEVTLGFFTHPNNRPILGVAPLQARYEWEPIGRWSPYLLAGLGVLYAKINARESGSEINFNLSEAVGVRYRWTQKASLLVEYRHIHISNAGLDEPNSGLNTHTFFAGVAVALG